MVQHYGSHPQDVLAGIGPSICSAHYQVGSEVQEAAQQAFGKQADGLFAQLGESLHFDLWALH